MTASSEHGTTREHQLGIGVIGCGGFGLFALKQFVHDSTCIDVQFSVVRSARHHLLPREYRCRALSGAGGRSIRGVAPPSRRHAVRRTANVDRAFARSVALGATSFPLRGPAIVGNWVCRRRHAADCREGRLVGNLSRQSSVDCAGRSRSVLRRRDAASER